MNITAGKYKGRKIKTVKSDNVRPTSSKMRESIFNIIQLSEAGTLFYEGETRVLDLFAGSGIMGIEALSRGAKEAVFVEKDPEVAKILKQNLSIAENAKLITGDALRVLDRLEKGGFNFIFVDPPYKAGLYEPVLQKIKGNELIDKDGIIILEHDSSLNASEIAITLGFEVYKTKIYGDTGITIIFQG